MISNSPLFQVLVTAGNQAPAIAGKKPEELLSGQIGVFDYETNLTIDGTVPLKNRKFYLAVGVNKLAAAGSAITDIVRSAGSNIQKAAIADYNRKEYTAPVDKKVVITFGEILPLQDYAIKLLVANQEAYANYGFNLPNKSFTARSGKQVGTTGLADGNQLVIDLAAAINADDEKIFTTRFLDPTDNAVVSSANLAAWLANVANDGETLKLEITSSQMAIKTFANVNLKYNTPRGTDVFVSLVGFDSDASVVTTQALVFQQGSGYDIQEMEYVAGGWNGNPGVYRASDTTYLQGVDRLAVANGTYDQTTISYENIGIGGNEQYGSSLQTVIAVPAADNTTAVALKELLDLVINDIEPVV